MTTKNGVLGKFGENLFGHRNVGQQHELFDHRIGFANLLRLNLYGIVGLAIDIKSDFWRSEDESAVKEKMKVKMALTNTTPVFFELVGNLFQNKHNHGQSNLPVFYSSFFQNFGEFIQATKRLRHRSLLFIVVNY